MKGFASDNYAGAHPDVLAALATADATGHAAAYGDDPLTAHAEALVRRHLGDDAEVVLTLNGTGANVVGLQTLLRPWENVICAATAHINVDECGAPERFLGSKRDVPTPHGAHPDDVRAPTWVSATSTTATRVVAVTQSTELGTRYTPEELRALADTAHELGMWLYLDAARLANAAAGLGLELREVSSGCGVDVMSLGLTKNGALGVEAVVVLRPELHGVAPFARKQSMQLASKMRYLSAQVVALLEGDLWRRNAAHANAMAQRLAAGVAGAPGLRLSHPVEANAVFAELPGAAVGPLQQVAPFLEWDPARHQVRWMCAWDTPPEDVDAFAAAVHEVLAAT
jgi:threonine aldolase